jgi:hypothetical protein
MNLAVTGGRDVHVSDEDFAWLMSVYESVGGTLFVLGDCPTGVDREVRKRLEARLLSGDRSAPFVMFDADWKGKGLPAGPLRSSQMVDVADALARFGGNVGTERCTAFAKAKGIPIFRRT